MADILLGNFGLEIIKIFQLLSPTLDNFFMLFTLLGDLYFYVLIISIIYWCINKEIGINLATVMICTGLINTLIKGFFGWERPYLAHPDQVKVITSSTGYSFVSGHSQSTATLWGSILYYYKDSNYINKLIIVSTFLMIIVPISRLYLAVHYPSDVIVGFILGIVTIYFYIKISPKVINSLKNMNFWTLISIAMLTSFFLLAIEILNIMIAGNDLEIADPGYMSGLLLGTFLGIILEREKLNFSANPTRTLFVLTRIIIGLFFIGIAYLLPYIALKPIPGVEVEIIRHYLQFLLIGFVIAYLAPFMFTKFEKWVNKE